MDKQASEVPRYYISSVQYQVSAGLVEDHGYCLLSISIIYKPIPLFKEHVLLGNALDWQKFNWHKSHQQNGDRQMTHNHLKNTHSSHLALGSMSTPKLWLVPLASTLINHLLAKHPVLKSIFHLQFHKTKVHADSMFVAIYFENVLQFWRNLKKNISFECLTLVVKGAKTRFFKMWPKSMHDQKFEKHF